MWLDLPRTSSQSIPQPLRPRSRSTSSTSSSSSSSSSAPAAPPPFLDKASPPNTGQSHVAGPSTRNQVEPHTRLAGIARHDRGAGVGRLDEEAASTQRGSIPPPLRPPEVEPDVESQLHEHWQQQTPPQKHHGTPSEPQEPIHRKERSKGPFCVVEFVAEHPLFWLVCSFLAVVVILVCGLSTVSVQIEFDFNSFLKTDVKSAILWDIFKAAKESKPTKAGRDLSAVQSLVNKDITFTYVLTKSVAGGFFNHGLLSKISQFEQGLRQLPAWRILCNRTLESHRGLCETGISFVDYALPNQNIETGHVIPSSLRLDGKGKELLNTKAAVHAARASGIANMVFPSDFQQSQDAVSELRSVFRFTLPYGPGAAPGVPISSKEIKDKWDRLLADNIIPYVKQTLENEKWKRTMRVFYEGTDLALLELTQALKSDFLFTGLSFAFVHLYMLFHKRSLLLALTGPSTAVIAVPLAVAFNGHLLGVRTLNFTTFLALFLVVGFGADMIFIYADSWRDSASQKDTKAERILWTYWHGGKASFATTATTALSFFANLASVVRALRMFGCFMGLCVTLAWVTVSVLYVPLCLLAENCRTCNSKASAFSPFSTIPWHQEAGLFQRDRNSAGASFTDSSDPSLSPHPDTPSSVRSPRSSRVHTVGFMTMWAQFVYKRRLVFLVVPLILTPFFLALSITQLKISTEKPEMFPEDHNSGVQGAAAQDKFKSYVNNLTSFKLPSRVLPVCDPKVIPLNASCKPGVLWCEAQKDASLDVSTGTCACFRKDNTNCQGGQAHVYQRVVGLTGPTRSQLEFLFKKSLENFSTSMADWDVSQQQEDLPMLLQQWETGLIEYAPYVMETRGTPPSNIGCGFEELCFCGRYVCNMRSNKWRRLPNVKTPMQTPPRRVEFVQPTVPSKLRAKLYVVWGLRFDASMPILAEHSPSKAWSFNDDFNIEDPWAQRRLYFFCRDLPTKLRVVNTWCWMKDFRDYQTGNGGRFPTLRHEFRAAAQQFDQGEALTSGPRYVWTVGDTIRAVYVSVQVDFRKTAGATAISAFKERWDGHLQNYNAKAETTARGAFTVSSLWPNSEKQDALLQGTFSTLIVLLGLSFTGVLLFTWSFILSMFVFICTLMVIIGLLFVIVVVCGWDLGLVEVIALIYFVGYAVTYSLHVAHKYADRDAVTSMDVRSVAFVVGAPDCVCTEPAVCRLQRTLHSVQAIGGATFSSAATTAGSSLFLVFCTLGVFKKLGAMCMAVTLLSIIMALGPLPAILFVLGPRNPGCRRQTPNAGIQVGASEQDGARSGHECLDERHDPAIAAGTSRSHVGQPQDEHASRATE